MKEETVLIKILMQVLYLIAGTLQRVLKLPLTHRPHFEQQCSNALRMKYSLGFFLTESGQWADKDN